MTPPHNSFVNIVYRIGLLGTIPFVLLLGLGTVRLARRLRTTLTPEQRARLVALAAMGVFIAVTACFNGALESPYMGIFFWTVLALWLRPGTSDDGVRASRGEQPV